MTETPRFRSVLRGYEPMQVDQRLAELSHALRSAQGELQQQRSAADDLQGAVSRLTQERDEARAAARAAPPASPAEAQASTFEDLGGRIAQILGLARAEADDIRGSAIADISALRLDAETQATALREEIDRYATDARSDAAAQAARMIQDAQRQVDELLAGADREASVRREETEALHEQQRAAATASAAVFEATLAEHRQRAEVHFSTQSEASDAALREAQDRAESARTEAERAAVVAQRDAEQLLADARQRADDLITSATGHAEQVRRVSERELSAATSHRDSVDAQLTDVRQMLQMLSGAAPAAPAIQLPAEEQTTTDAASPETGAGAATEGPADEPVALGKRP